MSELDRIEEQFTYACPGCGAPPERLVKAYHRQYGALFVCLSDTCEWIGTVSTFGLFPERRYRVARQARELASIAIIDDGRLPDD